MFITDDPVADYDRYCMEQDKLVERMPRCEDCDHHITDDRAHYINGAWVCISCMDSYLQEVLPE